MQRPELLTTPVVFISGRTSAEVNKGMLLSVKSGHCSHVYVKRQGSVGRGRGVSLVEEGVRCKKVYVLV